MRLLFSAVVPLLASPFAMAQAPLASWLGNPAESLGAVTRSVGDFDGDGRPDFAASAAHSLRVYSSATLGLLREFPSPVAEPDAIVDFDFADCNGDGTLDLIVGLPASSALFTQNGSAWVFSGSNGQLLLALQGVQPLEEAGRAVLALGDISGDGKADFAVSSPGWNSHRGRVQFVSGANGAILATRTGTQPGDRFGQVMEFVGDVNGDSRADLGIALRTLTYVPYDVVNRIDVLSLPGLATLYSMPCSAFQSFQCLGELNGDGIPDLAVVPPLTGVGNVALFVLRWGGSAMVEQSGPVLSLPPNGKSAITAPADLDGDGVADEFLVGAGDDSPVPEALGRVFVCRGTSIVHTIYDAHGRLGNGFGSSLALIGDLDGNGTAEFVAGTPCDGTESFLPRSGRLVVMSTVTPEPIEYCTAKTNGLGCVPQLSFSGVASLSGTEVLSIAASNVLNRRTGLCIWGTQRQEVPFAGGYLCVAPPFQRGPATNSGGSVSGDDCSGRLEFNLLPLAMWLHGVEIGDLVRLQFWQRDPLNADGTGASLSAACEARVGW